MSDLFGRRFAAVLFDMDGTLIDSTPAVERSWAQWFTERGFAADSFSRFHGVPAADIVATFVPDPAEREVAVRRINDLELADLEGIVALPGALEAFAVLPAERVAIATSCTRPLAEARIRAGELPRPRVLVTADDVEHGKPSPDPFLVAAAGLGVRPDQCLVVEDAAAGLAAGRAAGCATLAVLTGGVELPADLSVRDLSEISWQVDDSGITLAPRIL